VRVSYLTAAIFVILFGSPSSPVTAQSGLLLDHAKKAQANDPAYQSAKQSLSAAQESVKAAESLLGPRISMTAGTQRSERVEETRAVFGSVDLSRRFDSTNVTVQARQPLLRMRDRLTVEQAKLQLDSAQYAVASAEQDLYFRLISSWIDVLSSRELFNVYTESRAAIEDLLKESVKRLAAGESTIQDLEQVRAKIAQADALVEQSRALVASANLAFELLVGEKTAVPPWIRLTLFLSLPISTLSQSDLRSGIEQKNPEVLSLRLSEDAARVEREKARSERLPTIEAFASAMRGQNSSFSFIKDEKNLGVQLTVPLYTHGSIEAAVAVADAAYRKSQIQTRAAINRILIDATSALGGLSAFTARITAADQSVAAAKVVLRAQQGGLRAGINSRAEVAQAVSDLLAAQRDQVQIRKDYASAWLKIQVAQGVPLSEKIAGLEKNFAIEDGKR